MGDGHRQYGKRPFTVVLTGPESTGKTTLARTLAAHFGGAWVPEYAREYIEHLGRPYTYDDVLHILQYQIKVLEDPAWQHMPFLFLDTDLIILKVWFAVKYGKVPDELDRLIAERKIDLYLLCLPDLPWVDDPVRENPGERREELFRIYKKELEEKKLPYHPVSGRGRERTKAAIEAVREAVKKNDHGRS